MLSPMHETQEQQPAAASTGDQPEPEVTALYTLEEAMSPKPETRQEPRQSESHRGRSPRRAAPQAPSRGTVTRSAVLLAQSALAAASGSNAELFGKMISQAEKAVEEAKAKGIEAHQALKDRQEDLAQLKAEAEHNRDEVKEAMAKVRAEGRATSAPPIPSRRLRADLESGVHPRAAKKADKARQELPVIELLLAEIELQVGKGSKMQLLRKMIQADGIWMTWETSLNHPSLASWNPNVIEEVIIDLNVVDKMKPGRRRTWPRCLR